jgi:hypothetical protein
MLAQIGTSSDINAAQITTDAINSYFSTLTVPSINVTYTNSTNPVPPDNGSSSNTTLIVAIVVPICVVRKFCSI